MSTPLPLAADQARADIASEVLTKLEELRGFLWEDELDGQRESPPAPEARRQWRGALGRAAQSGRLALFHRALDAAGDLLSAESERQLAEAIERAELRLARWAVVHIDQSFEAATKLTDEDRRALAHLEQSDTAASSEADREVATERTRGLFRAREMGREELQRMIQPALAQCDQDEQGCDGSRSEFCRRLETFQSAERELLKRNLRLVPWVIDEYCVDKLPRDSMIDSGLSGLLKAVRRFECERGTRFTTHAVWWIRQPVGRACDDYAAAPRVPSHCNVRLGDLRRREREIWKATGRAPLLEDLHSLADYPQENTRGLTLLLAPVLLLSARASANGDVLDDRLPDTRMLSPSEARSRAVLAELLGTECEAESGKRRSCDEHRTERVDVHGLRLGIGQAKTATLKEIGDRIGLCRERVRQIHSRFLARVRRRHGRSLRELI